MNYYVVYICNDDGEQVEFASRVVKLINADSLSAVGIIDALTTAIKKETCTDKKIVILNIIFLK